MKMWKPINGYEQYCISSDGEVKNEHGDILKPFVVGAGYFQVSLWCDGMRKKKYIHRLVAEAFVENINNCKEVNHKDGNKHNNCADNLEWCTRHDNLIHSCYTLNNLVKRVRCIETNITYPSIKEAAKQTGLHRASITLCCNGGQKQTHGFHWEFVKEGVA